MTIFMMWRKIRIEQVSFLWNVKSIEMVVFESWIESQDALRSTWVEVALFIILFVCFVVLSLCVLIHLVLLLVVANTKTGINLTVKSVAEFKRRVRELAVIMHFLHIGHSIEIVVHQLVSSVWYTRLVVLLTLHQRRAQNVLVVLTSYTHDLVSSFGTARVDWRVKLQVLVCLVELFVKHAATDATAGILFVVSGILLVGHHLVWSELWVYLRVVAQVKGDY